MSTQVENPYIGPRSFYERDRRSFYGREQEARDIVHLIIPGHTLLIYSPSGAGKSSLINARILPNLREKEGFEVWPVVRVASHFSSEVISLDSIENIYIYSLLTNLDTEESGPSDLSRTTFQEYLAAKGPPLDNDGQPTLRIIVIDQLEELFTTHVQKWQHREGFFEQLGNSLKEDNSLRIIFLIREEYLAQLDTYAHLLPDGFRNRYRLERLRPANAREALIGPLKSAGREFAEDAAEEIVAQLRSIRSEGGTVLGEFIEPVQLQVVGYQLWENLPPDVTTITRQDVVNFGDVSQSLINYYESAIKKVIAQVDVKEMQIREWFDYSLITPAGTRGLVYQDRDKTDGLPNEVVRLLNEAYLIRAEYRGGSVWYELAHDRLIDPIKQSNELWRNKDQRLALQFREKVLDSIEGSNRLNILSIGIFIGIVTGIFGTLLVLGLLSIF